MHTCIHIPGVEVSVVAAVWRVAEEVAGVEAVDADVRVTVVTAASRYSCYVTVVTVLSRG